MQKIPFFVSLLSLVFVSLLFPTMQELVINATNAGNLTGAEGTVIQQLPLILVLITAIIPVYFGAKGETL